MFFLLYFFFLIYSAGISTICLQSFRTRVNIWNTKDIVRLYGAGFAKGKTFEHTTKNEPRLVMPEIT